MPEIDEVRFWRLRSRIGLGPRKALESCLEIQYLKIRVRLIMCTTLVDSTRVLVQGFFSTTTPFTTRTVL